MNIYEALKSEDQDIRITCGHNLWLVWDNSEWVVLLRKYHARQNTCLYRGDSCDTAIGIMLDGEI